MTSLFLGRKRGKFVNFSDKRLGWNPY